MIELGVYAAGFAQLEAAPENENAAAKRLKKLVSIFDVGSFK
jgi:hypothetical protein